MKKRITSLFLAGLLSLSIITGCGKSEEKKTEATTEVTTEAATETDTEAVATVNDANGTKTKDRAGNDIVIPEKVDKIISMAPS